tara:strand:+ start:158 stop:1282 length:1125 start_codon:yes stop_codon:yes gene_type:complete
MKKLIFKNLNKDIASFFLLTTLGMSSIVWIIQSVNLLDYMSEDGHGFRVYFLFSILSIPKIFSRILPFMFFISIFYTLIKYEENNELIIFWLNGINKMRFMWNIMIYSIIFLIIQILFTTLIVPKTQDLARSYIRSSTIDFFPNLIKEKKFIDVISDVTIYIEKKEKNGELSNIFLKDSPSQNNYSQTIYAKKGRLLKKNNQHILVLNYGKIINNSKNKTTIFSFDETQFNLSKYSTKSTTFPKVTELKTGNLLGCVNLVYFETFKLFKNAHITCSKKSVGPIVTETLRRLYLPLYLPVIGLITCFLVLLSKDNYNYKKFKFKIFMFCVSTVIVSEFSIRYSGGSLKQNLIFLCTPIILFIFSFLLFNKQKALN